MGKNTYVGNVLDNPKYKNQQKKIEGQYQIAVENAAHADRMVRFNGAQGHGYAAEQANTLLDKIQGKDAMILGDDNAKNGPDRMVNGSLIQSKYCKSAADSVNAAFHNGKYRYVDAHGNAMQIEVPKDQYNEAIEYMRRRIEKGQVPGVTNPNDADKLVRRGNIDYKTACRIAKAGNIESLSYDAAHGVVVATSAIGISAVITLAKSVWDGDNLDKAIDRAMYSGLQAGGIAFASSVLTAQLTRTAVNDVLLSPSIEIVRLLPSSARHAMVNSLRQGSLIYGNAATNNLAKLLRSNAIAAGAMIVVLSAGDITNFFRGRMSAKQLFKNVTTLVAGVGGGYAGAAAGGAAGSVFGPIGTAVGAVIGGVIGGAAASTGTNKILSSLVEDDVAEMLNILNQELIPLVDEYLLSEEELGIVLDDLRYVLEREKLLQMFACEDRVSFAHELLISVIENVVKWRVFISLPPNEMFVKGIGHVWEMSEHDGELQRYFSQGKMDTKQMGKKLLGKEISSHAADKAWYLTRQMNAISTMQENSLMTMESNEKSFVERRKKDETELQAYKREVDMLLRR